MDFKGEVFTSKDITSNNPSKFAVALVRKLKGPDYLTETAIDPAPGTTKRSVAEDAFVLLIKCKH